MSRRFRAPVTQWALLASCGGLLCLWSLARPQYNWDMLAYSAATQRLVSADPVQWHRATYENARHFLPAADFERLVGGDPQSFRARVHQDAELFAAHLDFYTGRVAYIGATWVLEQLGLNPLRAQHVVSAAAVLLGLLCLALLSGALSPGMPLILLPAVGVLFGLLQILRLGTPDALTFAAVCGAALLLLRRERALLLLLPVLIGVRTDLILFTLPLYGFLLYERTFARRAVASSLLGSVLLFVILQWGHPGWSTLLQVTLVAPESVDPTRSATVDAATYGLLLKRGLLELSNDKAALLFLFLAVSTLVWARSRRAFDARQRVLLFLVANSLVYLVLHFLLFPVFWERFFVGTYCIAVVSLASLRGAPRPRPAETSPTRSGRSPCG